MNDHLSPRLDFWFELASTYSYPAAMRIMPLAHAAGVVVRWRPFLLGPLFKAQGWNDSPFNLFPAKGTYMWRDLERICAGLNLPFRRPESFPQNGLLATRVALVGLDAGWGEDFVRAVYRAEFTDGRQIGDAAVIAALLEELGHEAETIFARAQSSDVKERVRANTAEARALGIFGAPSFLVGGELFWGNDRLEQALDRAKAGFGRR